MDRFTKMPKLNPAELSKMKADKEARDQQETRKRNEEVARQQQILCAKQAQRAAAPPAVRVIGHFLNSSH